ncbi:MAG: Fe2+-dependent dioxygenase [Sedimenticolaceae bacterium]|nr:Fe2+-dependent dioxygenase [Sedimenticolaceae bacterium]
MLLQIPGLLSQPQIDKIHDLIARSAFRDGRETAGVAARLVKSNEEMTPDEQAQQLLNRILMSSLGEQQRFHYAAMPAKLADFILARYEPGMEYGDHVDEPVMGGPGPKFRTDISMTVFLTPPESYDGGELVMRTSFGDNRVKLAAGDAVMYPSSSLHHVAKVTRGQRIVALTWIQSQVRDPARREILFDLATARDRLHEQESGSELHQRVDRSYANLLRMWAEV